jgi:2-polyprenyl-6-methoxyphenol hydroxylase-like FAD-dependent oxidoreductase
MITFFWAISAELVNLFAVLNRAMRPEELNTTTLPYLFRDFQPRMADTIKTSKNVHPTKLMDFKRLKIWSNSNICHSGDNTHATTPNIGHGACQGIEDTFYIRQYLKKCDSPLKTFKAFENQRRNRRKLDCVVNSSRNFGRMAHSEAGQLLLKGIMKMTAKAVMSQQMNRVYTVEGL